MLSKNKNIDFGKDYLLFHNLPFITGVYEKGNAPKGIKPSLPFELRFSRELGYIMQHSNQEVDRELMSAYQQGSMISTPLGVGSINSPLVSEIVERIDVACGGIKGKSFFEPGCGTGFLLKKIKDQGAQKVSGCEPGPQAQISSQLNEVIIHNAFLNDLHLSESFDCIFHYGVMEHIKDVGQFLRQCISMLKDEGVFFAVVPGCQRDFEYGNFMALAHEHYNYFTENSLKYLLERADLAEVSVCELKFSKGIVCAWGRKSSRKQAISQAALLGHLQQEADLLARFIKKTEGILTVLEEKARTIEMKGRSLGFYGAPRTLSGLLEFQTPPRIFDSDTFKHGKYFSGSVNPVESPFHLLQDPVDEIWILPIHHDQAIRKFLEKEILPHRQIEICSILELMSHI